MWAHLRELRVADGGGGTYTPELWNRARRLRRVMLGCPSIPLMRTLQESVCATTLHILYLDMFSNADPQVLTALVGRCDCLQVLSVEVFNGQDRRPDGDWAPLSTAVGTRTHLRTLELCGVPVQDWRALVAQCGGTLREIAAESNVPLDLRTWLPRVPALTHLGLCAPCHFTRIANTFQTLPWPTPLRHLELWNVENSVGRYMTVRGNYTRFRPGIAYSPDTLLNVLLRRCPGLMSVCFHHDGPEDFHGFPNNTVYVRVDSKDAREHMPMLAPLE